MSTGAVGAPAGVAPAQSGGGAPAGGSQSSPGASQGGGDPSPSTVAPTGSQPSSAAPPPARTPVPWKTKHRIGDQEHELEIDVSPFLDSYRRKVKLPKRQGEGHDEVDVPVEEAFKSYERVRSSMARFDEASRLRKEAETMRSEMQEREKRIEAALRDPKKVLALARQTLGEDVFLASITEQIAERIEYEKLSPQERAQRDRMTEAEKRAATRERELAQRAAAIERKEREVREAEERRMSALADVRQQQLIAEWTPKIEAAGLPAKLGDKPNMRIIRMVASTMQDAKRSGIAMTLEEAIGIVREEYEAMVGHSVQARQAAAIQAAQEQPGIAEPMVSQRRAPPQRSGVSFEDFERSLRNDWQRRR